MLFQSIIISPMQHSGVHVLISLFQRKAQWLWIPEGDW